MGEEKNLSKKKRKGTYGGRLWRLPLVGDEDFRSLDEVSG
jgi:hypothetical protein